MTILVKIFAVALALSQVTTRSDVKTQFDPVVDRAEVVQLLRDGCMHMIKAFDVEHINIDELITIAMNDPQAVAGDKVFKGINFDDLLASYRQFCKGDAAGNPTVDVAEIIAFYNNAVSDLPDVARLKDQKLRGLNVILDGKGKRFADDYEPGQRRLSVPLSDIPDVVQKAFVAVEDRRFFSHRGVDERGLIRAFVGNLVQPGRPQGGSTITQQVVKNLLVGDDVTYERKIREMIVASRLERALTKAEILELYLNSIYLGRSAWGVELAARRYFGKPAKELSAAEGAFLAGLTKGPSYFSPDRYPDRAQARFEYVLNRMREDGAIDADSVRDASAAMPRMVALQRPGRDSGLYFIDQIRREAKAAAGIDLLTGGAYTVRSTINPGLQRALETALQDGLVRYEVSRGRVDFQGPETNLTATINRLQAAEQKHPSTQPAWQRALATAHLMLYDVHWTPAIVIETSGGRSGTKVGLADGRTLPLTVRAGKAQRALKLYDVVYVSVGSGKSAARAELRVPPVVQGAAVVLENKTGKILAMTGGFSYPLSQLNRVTQSQRQPGSTIKPLTYLAALQAGLQPNTLVPDEPITLAPIGGKANAQEKDYWSPKNYDGGGSGITTLRRALENSRNLVTAHLLDGGIEKDPALSLKRVCALALDAKLYSECMPYYPFVLGAQPVRPIDLAAFYAAIANEGARPTPYTLEAIEQSGKVIYRREASPPVQLQTADRVAFYQLKTMLAGVLERGTAAGARELVPYVGGKTGTSEEENDTWFAGFTNDVTVVVWVGYDNAEGTHRTLGQGSTGASVALPIFQNIVHAAWSNGVPRAALSPPSREARARIADKPIDLASGALLGAGSRGFMEHFRLDDRGAIVEHKVRFGGEEVRQPTKVVRVRPIRRAPQQVVQCYFFFCNNNYPQQYINIYGGSY
jgi:penicillin-binding protein 1A